MAESMPPGIRLVRDIELDPFFGEWERWAYVGRVGRTGVYGSGYWSCEEAREAAWAAYRRLRR